MATLTVNPKDSKTEVGESKELGLANANNGTNNEVMNPDTQNVFNYG